MASLAAQPLAALSQSTATAVQANEAPRSSTAEKGFFELLVQSIWEPGANYAVVMAMNISFFFLILVLFALAFLTSWNPHVLLLLSVTTLLWGAMIWFVIELTKMQLRPDNMPPADRNSVTAEAEEEETKKDQ